MPIEICPSVTDGSSQDPAQAPAPGFRRSTVSGERRGRWAGLALLLGLVAGACTVPVATGIDDPDANRVVAALESAGIAAEKAQDPGGEGRYRVEVPGAEAARAVALLGEQGLPPRKVPGMLEALGTGDLVPSRAAEHERLLVGLAGELERTLAGIDGVVSARVHLAMPRRSPLRDDPEARPSASVLVQYRGKASPLPDADVRKLVTHAVVGLEPERVFVASVAVPSPLPRDLERVGPLTTTHDVAQKLRVALFALAVLGLALAACIVFLWSRARLTFRKRIVSR